MKKQLIFGMLCTSLFVSTQALATQIYYAIEPENKNTLILSIKKFKNLNKQENDTTDNFSGLRKDVTIKILKNLDLESLQKMSQTSPKMYLLCQQAQPELILNVNKSLALFTNKKENYTIAFKELLELTKGRDEDGRAFFHIGNNHFCLEYDRLDRGELNQLKERGCFPLRSLKSYSPPSLKKSVLFVGKEDTKISFNWAEEIEKIYNYKYFLRAVELPRDKSIFFTIRLQQIAFCN